MLRTRWNWRDALKFAALAVSFIWFVNRVWNLPSYPEQRSGFLIFSSIMLIAALILCFFSMRSPWQCSAILGMLWLIDPKVDPPILEEHIGGAVFLGWLHGLPAGWITRRFAAPLSPQGDDASPPDLAPPLNQD